MSSRRDGSAVTTAPARPGRSQALGEALEVRADDCWRMCEERLDALGIGQVGDPEFRARRRASQLLGVRLFARWLRTGELTSIEDRTWLGGLGELGARSGVSIVHLTRGYLIFRDVVRRLIDEEAVRLETPVQVLDDVHEMNALSCDSSLVWMSHYFDRQTAAQAAEARRLHAELAASESRFRSVYESISCGVAVVGPDGTVMELNDAAVEMLEMPREAAVGSNVLDVAAVFRDESGREMSRVPTAEVLVSRQPIRGRVVKHDFGDGRPVRWHQVDAVPILGPDGELVQVISTLVDVTAVKNAEELRHETAAKDQFLATMSHELRTPLNSILGFAQLLRAKGGSLDEKQRRYVANIETSGTELLALISDLLDLGQAGPGEAGRASEPVDLEEAIRHLETDFETLVAGRLVDLRLELAAGLRVSIDPPGFRQLMVNLVANALKFSEAGAVVISTRRLRGKAEIRVADSGIGIPADQLERVFDDFTQVDAGATRARGGTGIGLALSRRLVGAMGGSIRLESAPGRGTTAVVLLPIAA